MYDTVYMMVKYVCGSIYFWWGGARVITWAEILPGQQLHLINGGSVSVDRDAAHNGHNPGSTKTQIAERYNTIYAVLGTIEEKGYNTYPIGKCNKAEAFLPTVTSHYRVHLLSRYFDII